jgi:hypothetical protein
MPQVILPNVRDAENPELQVQYLYDAYYKIRKELEYLLQNLDSDNVIEAQSVVADWVYAGTVTTDQLVAGKAKIGTAMIDELIVGSNVGLGTAQDAQGVTTIVGGLITTDYIKALGLKVGDHIDMGPNATISWSNVTNQPSIPSQYTNAMALAAWANSGYATYINANGVYSGSFNGGMFNINPTGSRYLESGLTVGGYWGGSWKGQALKLQFYESGGGGTPVTAFSSSGGVPLWFDVQTRFNSLVDFSGATVTGLNYASVNHSHGNDYVKSYTGQNLSLVATETGIAVRVNGVTLGSIFYD